MDVRLSIVIAAAAAQLAVLDVRPALAGDALYFSAYEDIRSRLVSRIRAEQVRLDVAVWYLTDRAVSKAIADKYRSGVPVRVLGDRVSIFENDGNTRREFEYLATSGVPIRVRYHPTWFPRAMHWKAAIFVGQNVVEFGSANFTSFELKPWSTTNYHDEVAFFTTDRAILNAFKTQFDRFWADTTSFMDFDDAYEREVGEPFPVRVVVDRARLEPDYPKPSTIVWGQGAELSARMVAEIQRETAFIHMVVFRLTDARITEALLERRRAGVPVRVIIEPAEYNRRTYPEYEMTRAQIDRLWAGGVAVRQRAHAGLTHMKTLITSRVALIASSNFTNNWQRDHNYFLPQSAKPALHLEMRNRFRAMWNAVVSVDGLPPAFRAFTPRPPAAAQLMAPANGALRVSRTPRLQWRRAAWAVAYDVYAGTSPTSLRFMGRVPAVVSENPPATYSWSPPAPFAARTTVYWRVVSRTNATPRSPKMIARSTVWSFTTE